MKGACGSAHWVRLETEVSTVVRTPTCIHPFLHHNRLLSTSGHFLESAGWRYKPSPAQATSQTKDMTGDGEAGDGDSFGGL